MRQRRVPLLGALAGIVLLVLVVGFAVGLPKVDGATATDVSDALPDTLPDVDGIGALEADDTLDGSQEERDYAESIAEREDSAAANVEDALEVPTDVRVYSDPETGVQIVAVVVASGDSVRIPDQLPVDAELLGLQQAPTELVRDGDVVCSASYQQAAPTDPTDPTAAPEADPAPASVSCQLSDSTRTFALQGSGFGTAEAADLLRALAA